MRLSMVCLSVPCVLRTCSIEYAISPAAMARMTATSANSCSESPMFLNTLRRIGSSVEVIACEGSGRAGERDVRLFPGNQVFGVEQDQHLVFERGDAVDQFGGARRGH